MQLSHWPRFCRRSIVQRDASLDSIKLVNDGQVNVQRTAEEKRRGRGEHRVGAALDLSMIGTAYVLDVYNPVDVLERYSSNMFSNLYPTAV